MRCKRQNLTRETRAILTPNITNSWTSKDSDKLTRTSTIIRDWNDAETLSDAIFQKNIEDNLLAQGAILILSNSPKDIDQIVGSTSTGKDDYIPTSHLGI